MEVDNNFFEHHIRNPESLVSDRQYLDNMLDIDKDNSKDLSYTKSLINKAVANLKHVLRFILIIITVITISMSSFKQAEAGLILGDHRYTKGAVAADMSQCAALIALWYGARVASISMFQSMLKSLYTCALTLNPYACTAAPYLQFWYVYLSDVIAAGVLFGAWVALEEWAEATRQSVHVLNNFDEGDPYYCEKFDHRNDIYINMALSMIYIVICNQQFTQRIITLIK